MKNVDLLVKIGQVRRLLDSDDISAEYTLMDVAIAYGTMLGKIDIARDILDDIFLQIIEED